MPFPGAVNMDWQPFLNTGLFFALGAVGWLIRTARNDQKESTDRLTAFQLKVAEEYVTHVHLRDIRDALIRIETRLNERQGKA